MKQKKSKIAKKTVLLAMLSAVVLGLVSLFVGLGIYSDSLITDSIALTRSTATKAAAAAAHGTDTAGLSADVMGVYKSLTPEQRSMTGTEEYRQCFQSLNSVSGAGRPTKH